MIEMISKLVDQPKELTPSALNEGLPRFFDGRTPETNNMTSADNPIFNNTDFVSESEIAPKSEAGYKSIINQTPIKDGTWTGERGESTFKTDDPALKSLLSEFGIDGISYSGGFPDFSPVSIFDGKLPPEQYEATNIEQKKTCLQQLQAEIKINPELSEKFSPDNLTRIENGITPKGYVWHHGIEPGQMQLVPETIHQKYGHYGGQYLWAGGTENR